MPFYPLVDATNVSKSFLCAICSNPWEVDKAVTCPVCEEVFDAECVQDLALKQKSCKTAGCTGCLENVKDAPHKSVRALADASVAVRCQFHLRGCSWQGKRSEFGDHVVSCPRCPPNIVYDGPVPSELQCSICHEAFTDARFIKQCDHTFCAACIDKALTITARCPNCTVAATVADLVKAPKQINTEADKIVVKCSMFDAGCPWKGTRREFIGHRATCSFHRGAAPGSAPMPIAKVIVAVEPTIEFNTLVPQMQSLHASVQTLTAALTIHAPELVKLEDRKDPLCISAVIDVSGSMEGERLNLAKETLLFMIDQLSSRDELGVIAFDTDVSVTIPLTMMDDVGKNRAKDAVRTLRAGSSTNLHGGLIAGVRQAVEVDVTVEGPIKNLKKSKKSVGFFSSFFGSSTPPPTSNSPQSKARAVLLLTDGQANVGPTSAQDIVKSLKQEIDTAGGARASVHTFGFGEGHNADLLRAIAEATQGCYYFIESTATMKNAFADCLGGLVSIVLQHIEVEVASAVPALMTIKRVMTKFPVSVSPSGSHIVSITDMYSQEARDILVEVEVGAQCPTGNSVDVLKWTLRYDNSISGKHGNVLSGNTNVSFSVAPYTGPVNLKVDEQKMRILVTESLEKARQAANEHRMDDARNMITSVQQVLVACPSAQSAKTMGMAKEMDECTDMLVNEDVYQQRGTKVMNKMEQCHGRQRCNSASMENAYATGWKGEMKKRSK